MTLVLDTAFHDRAQHQRVGRMYDRLAKALLTPEFLATQPASAEGALRGILAQAFDEASQLGLLTQLDHAKYALILVTQGKWRHDPRAFAYAHRMIGDPNRGWSLTAGVRAVFQNIVAAHYLDQSLLEFVADQESEAQGEA